MEMESESGSCDTVHAREQGPPESRLIPDAVIQICREGKGVRWDNGRLCYEVQDPVAFEARYKELLQHKIGEWTWNQLDKYYSLWQSSRWSRKGSCFTPRDVLETRFWQRLALAPAFQPLEAMAAAQNEKAHMHELLEAACEHRQEKLALQKRVKTLLGCAGTERGESIWSRRMIGRAPSLKIVRCWGWGELFGERQRCARAHHFQPYFRAFASCSASILLKSCRPPLFGMSTK
jgi:hypothetical protein